MTGESSSKSWVRASGSAHSAVLWSCWATRRIQSLLVVGGEEKLQAGVGVALVEAGGDELMQTQL